MNEVRYIKEAINLEQRTNEDGSHYNCITGYGIVFDKPSQILKMRDKMGRVREFEEIISKEAVNNVDFSNLVCMLNHKYTLGKRSRGTMSIEIDDFGVKYSVKLPNTSKGNDTREDIINGNLEGSSFQFVLDKEGDAWDMTRTPIRRCIKKFSEILEMGPVYFPAYPDTTVAMRSLEKSEENDNIYKPNYKLLKIKLLKVKK